MSAIVYAGQKNFVENSVDYCFIVLIIKHISMKFNFIKGNVTQFDSSVVTIH